MEGAIMKKTGELVSLSEQNLVDCDHQSSACNGGLEIYAFDYVIKNGGINTEADYPYESGDGSRHSCRYDDSNRVLTISDYTEYPRDEELLTNTLSTEGPVSITDQPYIFIFFQTVNKILQLANKNRAFSKFRVNF